MTLTAEQTLQFDSTSFMLRIGLMFIFGNLAAAALPYLVSSSSSSSSNEEHAKSKKAAQGKSKQAKEVYLKEEDRKSDAVSTKKSQMNDDVAAEVSTDGGEEFGTDPAESSEDSRSRKSSSESELDSESESEAGSASAGRLNQEDADGEAEQEEEKEKGGEKSSDPKPQTFPLEPEEATNTMSDVRDEDAGQQQQQQQRLSMSGAGAWRPRRASKGAGLEEKPEDKVLRLVRSTLNKLTRDKYVALYPQLLDRAGIQAKAHMEVLSREIFEKATTQHHLVELYADLCVDLEKDLSKGLPAASGGKEEKTLKRVLLEQCQAFFERNLVSASSPEQAETEETEEEILEKHLKQKERMLGNVKFVGELLKRRVLSPKIIFLCVEELLLRKTEASLETLCTLLENVCPVFDVPAWPMGQMQFAVTFQTFRKMVMAKGARGAPTTRVRCLIQDLLEKKARNWEAKTQSPSSQHQQPQPGSPGSLGSSSPGSSPEAPTTRPRHPQWQRSPISSSSGSPKDQDLDRNWARVREGGTKLRETAAPGAPRSTVGAPKAPRVCSTKTREPPAEEEMQMEPDDAGAVPRTEVGAAFAGVLAEEQWWASLEQEASSKKSSTSARRDLPQAQEKEPPAEIKKPALAATVDCKKAVLVGNEKKPETGGTISFVDAYIRDIASTAEKKGENTDSGAPAYEPVLPPWRRGAAEGLAKSRNFEDKKRQSRQTTTDFAVTGFLLQE